ncbi:MAG: hypothetical protein KGD68_04350 [Candidatus Lokiarchaeota archaeon]|nr:hypothetical protein [Candidatus Lokiarchaeota archaeon]
MEQALLREKEPEVKIEFIILEELPVEQELPKEVEVKVEEKPGKKALLKLLKKGKYNAKYLEELVSVNDARRMVHYRNYGVR